MEVFVITKEDREISNMIDNAIGQYYDLEVIKNRGHLSIVDMGKRNLSSAKLDRYFNVKLININGIFTTVEYDEHCKGCGRYLGHYSYGHWEY